MSSSAFSPGVLAASLTPFHSDSDLAPEAFLQHNEWLLANGCDGLLLFGTTGEGLSLTVEERIEGLHTARAELPPERLLVGTGALALPDAVRLTREATSDGVGGVLVLPPFHYRSVKDEGVFRFYDELIQGVGDSSLGLYLYHFPELTGVPISFSVIQHLLDRYPSQIAGIKDSSGEWDHTDALCREFPDLEVFTGTERLLLPTLQAGGDGCITDTVNLTASYAARVLSAWQNDREAAPLQDTLTDLRTAFASFPTIPALKHLLSTLREDAVWDTVRPPLVPLPDEEKKQVDEIGDQLRAEASLPRPVD